MSGIVGFCMIGRSVGACGNAMGITVPLQRSRDSAPNLSLAVREGWRICWHGRAVDNARMHVSRAILTNNRRAAQGLPRKASPLMIQENPMTEMRAAA